MRHLEGCQISRHVPFIPGEDPLERHRRRLVSARANVEIVRKWCEYRGVEFAVHNGNAKHVHAEYWVFRVRLRRASALARWHPALGRAERIAFFRGRKTKIGHAKGKVYDYEQLLFFLAEWLKETEMTMQVIAGPGSRLCWCGKPAIQFVRPGSVREEELVPLCQDHCEKYDMTLVRKARFGPATTNPPPSESPHSAPC